MVLLARGIIKSTFTPFLKSRRYAATGFPKIAAKRDFWEEEERSAHASIAFLGQCENAADCSDEGALTKSVIFARARKYKKGSCVFCVTLSEPPKRNGGESNGSEQFLTIAVCSLCC